jgi:preprotein translocase subunit SecE
MGDNNNSKSNAEKTQKTNWFTGLNAEFKKIIWPDKKSLTKQTIAVIIVSVLLGLIITALDVVIKSGVDFLVNL